MKTKNKYLTGHQLAGSNPTIKRPKYEYYATSFESTEALLKKEKFEAKNCLEPCIGQGHITKLLIKKYPSIQIDGIDIIKRKLIPGNENVNFIQTDFLKYQTNKKYDTIITNPPYSKAQEFLEKSINLTTKDGKIAMFLKIQFLESARRKKLFKKYPPKYIHVFSKRQITLRNGSEYNENGKKWSNTMCFAWFIWEKEYKNNPQITWI